jgi:quinol monooxygenase YgiN
VSAVPKVAVIATLTAQPGRRDDLVEIVSSMFGPVGEESGTEVYALHTLEGEPDTIVFYELYSDADALKAHSRSEAMKTMGAQLAGVLAGAPDIKMATPVQAKGVTF